MNCLQIKTVIIRGGDNFKRFGDPFDYSLSAYLDGDTALIYGLCGKFSIKDYRQVKEQFAKIGIYKAKWERYQSSRIKEVRIDKGASSDDGNS